MLALLAALPSVVVGAQDPAPTSVVLVTIEADAAPADAMQWLDAGWLGRSPEDRTNWWVGTGRLGSNMPSRAALGVLSGVPPVRFEAPQPATETLDAALVPRALSRSGAAGRATLSQTSVRVWLDGFRGERELVTRAVGGGSRYNQLRPVMRSLQEVEAPFFFWLAFRVADPNRRAGAAEVTDRVMAVIERRGLLDDTVVVLTTLDGAQSLDVPLAMRWPPAVAGQLRATSGSGADAQLSVESVGAAMKEVLGLATSPGTATSALGSDLQQQPMVSELRVEGELVGVVAQMGNSRAAARWRPNRLHTCFARRPTADCTWHFSAAFSSSRPDASLERGPESGGRESQLPLSATERAARERLESVVLVELERLVSLGLDRSGNSH